MKQVPSTAGALHIDAARCWLAEGGATETSAADIHALEEALRIKDQQETEVVAITIGPDRAVDTLKEALSKGADRALHIVQQDAHAQDPRMLAHSLAETMRPLAFDLIFAGAQSDDVGHGQTGVQLAALLGLPHISLVTEVVQQPGSILRVRRELEGGSYQWLQLALPCVLMVQSGINKPRYAGMKGMLAAKKKPIDRIESAVALPHSYQVVSSLYVPVKSKATSLLEGVPEEQADALINVLNLRAKLA